MHEQAEVAVCAEGTRRVFEYPERGPDVVLVQSRQDLYNWELGEAGGPTYTASKQSKFEMELDKGDYSITLTVEDPDGESDSITHSFKVTNLPPVASIDADVTSIFTGEEIQFSGEDSYDPEGDALDYIWDFGDNQTSSLKSPKHSWSQAGSYTVKLTVEDGDGQEGTATKNIEIM